MFASFESVLTKPGAKFELGEICVTPGVISKVSASEIMAGLRQHISGDWGELDSDGRAANERNLVRGTGPLSSIFKSARGITFYILTESDRSATTILLPEDF